MGTQTLPKDPFNIIITGVGGQGNVLASRVLANMLVHRGYDVTIGETFGASQRGGSVMSHIRVSARGAWSPQIPRGKADMVVSLEPVEAIRVMKDYGNEEVRILVNDRPIYPVGVIAGDLVLCRIVELPGDHARSPAPSRTCRGTSGSSTRPKRRSGSATPSWATSS